MEHHDSMSDARRVVHEARARRRRLSAGRIAAALFGLLLLLVCARLLAGCGGVTARDVLDASAVAGTEAHTILAARYGAASRACLDLDTSDAAEACLDAVDTRFAPAWIMYRAYLVAWRQGDVADRNGEADALERALAANRALGGVR